MAGGGAGPARGRVAAPRQRRRSTCQGSKRLVTDKGYHSGAVVKRVKALRGAQLHSGEETEGAARLAGQTAEQQAVYANRRRVRGEYGKSLLRRRGELVERSFAHCYETGAYAALPSAGAGKHSEAAVGPRGSVQPESDSAKTAGSGYAARAEKPRWAGVFATFALSAVPEDGRFADLAAYRPGWPPDSTHFSCRTSRPRSCILSRSATGC